MLRKRGEHFVTEAFECLVDYVLGGGQDPHLPLQTLQKVFEMSLRKMVGRVEKRVVEDLRYYLDALEDIVGNFIRYCASTSDDQVDLKYFLDLTEFVCGYYSEQVGAETRYRVARFALMCRQRPLNVRLIPMAASNVSQWMERTIF
jgi:hypothetical protein